MFTNYVLAAVLLSHACLAFPQDLIPRITDGVNASPNEFPHQVSIQWSSRSHGAYSHICGGSIVNEHYVLTAGHCVMKEGSTRVVVGKYQLNKADLELAEQHSPVDKAIVHSGYKGGVAQHDIALLHLQNPVTFTSSVQPVMLPRQGQMQSGNAVISGWGSISKNMQPKMPNILQKAYVPIMGNDECLRQLKSLPVAGQKPEIFSTQVCTGSAGKEVATCSGDSGGPLVQKNGGHYVQVGVVSWGMMPCGVSRMPSVYTRVASYVDWIHSHMK